ncbi:hypothetical protein WJX73_000965 [Symbiochloris irregularis]|uniref:Uncharacterized protein n=1 Tax=Symbiochloris irregularis TaxID=706552 RepID=A0AAW1NQ29_9CHLO
MRNTERGRNAESRSCTAECVFGQKHGSDTPCKRSVLLRGPIVGSGGLWRLQSYSGAAQSSAWSRLPVVTMLRAWRKPPLFHHTLTRVAIIRDLLC